MAQQTPDNLDFHISYTMPDMKKRNQVVSDPVNNQNYTQVVFSPLDLGLDNNKTGTKASNNSCSPATLANCLQLLRLCRASAVLFRL